MALVGDFKIIVTNLTGSPITFEDITNTVSDPGGQGYPTVAAASTLELILTREAQISWERGRLKAEIDAANITVTGSMGGGGGITTPGSTTVGDLALWDAADGSALGNGNAVFNGISVDNQGSNPLSIGENSGEIASTNGNLAIISNNALSFTSDDVMSWQDSSKAVSTYAGTFTLSSSDTDWDDFKTLFGEVSLIEGINAAAAAPAPPVQLQPLVGNSVVAFTDGTVAIATFVYDGSEYSGDYTTVEFQAVAYVSAGETGTITLYNLTDAEAVTVTGFTTVTATSPTKVEGTMTIGAAAGNLKDTEKVYEIRVSVTGTTAADTVTVGSAAIKLTP